MVEKYSQYSTEDFLNDDGFIAFVKQEAGADHDAWTVWVKSQPVNLHQFQAAKVYLETVLSAERIFPSGFFSQQVWSGIQQQIGFDQKRKARIRNIRLTVMSAAACLALVILGNWYYALKITISTGVAEQRKVVLPDGSEVQLNANSSLSYYKAWAWHNTRQTWLQGEGRFIVRHLNKDSAKILPEERFIVYSGKMQVDVLGTTFNVKQRRNSLEVALFEGKVAVASIAQPEKRTILQPGEFFSKQKEVVQILPTSQLHNPPQAWINHRIIAKGMTVNDIIENYEDIYGVKIVAENSAWLQITIDGTLMLDDGDEVVFALANLLNANTHREGKVIYLRER